MKKMIVLMIGLGVILGGCRKKEKQEAASGQAAPEILVNRPAQHDVVYTYQYPAYLEAVQTVNLVARVSGFLEKMNYIPGVPVKAGQLLFVHRTSTLSGSVESGTGRNEEYRGTSGLRQGTIREDERSDA